MYLLPVILFSVFLHKLYFTTLDALKIFYLYKVLIFIIMIWFVVEFLSLLLMLGSRWDLIVTYTVLYIVCFI